LPVRGGGGGFDEHDAGPGPLLVLFLDRFPERLPKLQFHVEPVVGHAASQHDVVGGLGQLGRKMVKRFVRHAIDRFVGAHQVALQTEAPSDL
jgi:hypothetical protein